MKDLIEIGKTTKPHGVEGHMKVIVQDIFLEDFLKSEVIFIGLNGQKVPFFIQKIDHNLNVIFENIQNREAAKKLSNKVLFLRKEDISSSPLEQEESFNTLFYNKVIHFKVRDENYGDIGMIQEVIEYPQQEMALIIFKTKEILIPLVPEFILNIDEQSQTILMSLPEGLLDL